MAAAPLAVQALPAPLILVVDDEPGMLRYLRTLLELDSYRVETASSGREALDRLQCPPAPNLVLMDLLMPDMDGLQLLQQAREMNPALNVVMLSCINDTRKAAQAVRLGALDYLSKPFQKSDLKAIIRDWVTAPKLAVTTGDTTVPEVVELSDDISFVCASAAMQRIYSQSRLIAKFDMPVLMLGESGTGKEVVSMLIHQLSPRASQPFLKVNCAAVPGELLESELFGYEAGAFTGATKSKPGKFEQCDRGTILLDEIGEMPPALQAKLLHVLQDRRFSRLGSRTTVKADVRVLAATNINLEEAIAAKKLREDLYHRLNGFTLHLPPLRERKKEIPLLLKHFMSRVAERYACPPLPVSQRLLQACLSYPWPGNLRQLENFVKRYLVLRDEELAISELRPDKNSYGEPRLTLVPPAEETGLKSLARSVKKEAEAEAIAHALQQTNWHRQKAATMLRISYKALLYKIKQYQLQPPQSDQN